MKRARKWFLPGLALVALFLLACFSPTVDLLSRPLRMPDRLRPADVVVAISAGKLSNCQAHPNLLQREIRGAELVKAGYSRSGKLIVSGIYTDPARVSLATCRDKLAARFGIAPQRLLIDNAARTTYENALGVKALMAANSYRDAVLVTSRSHMFRASKTFQKAGLAVYPVQVPDLPPFGDVWFDANHLAHIRRFLYEYGALIKYKWYGYI